MSPLSRHNILSSIKTTPDMNTFEQLESNVRSYCRLFPTIFKTAKGATLEDQDGHTYLDFLAGVGTLNYGHNHPGIKQRLLDYLVADGIVHGLDMATVAKQAFIDTFNQFILQPRQLSYKLQFPGPTGTNAVEAALKLARNVTGRENIISFRNGYHGVTLGSLAATAKASHRNAAGIGTQGVTFVPFEGGLGTMDTTQYLDQLISDRSSGVAHPAAVIVETIQGAGGVNVASAEWLRSLQTVCRRHDMLLIVDDIQVGCGRTGQFFSFEDSGISPDIVTLSKSLSGFGLPFALVLIKPEWDQWQPGQHSGTFRGPNLAFVTAKAALDLYWQDESFSLAVQNKGQVLRDRLEKIAQTINTHQYPNILGVRGRGMIQGLDCQDGAVAHQIIKAAFKNGLILETAGDQGEVIRCLPPLTISEIELNQGLLLLEKSIHDVMDIAPTPAKSRTLVEV